jgi:hypothetical protein
MSRRENYRTSSNYTSNSYNAGITKSTTTTNNNNNNNNNNNTQDKYRTRTIDPAVKARNDLAKKIAKQKKDALDFKNLKYEKPSGIAKYSPVPVLLDFTGIGKKTFEVNKSYYERNVIGKAKPGGGFYSASVEDYKNYISGRGSGDVDAMGRTITKSDGDGGRDFVVEKNVGGKTILTTEKKVAKDAEAKKEYDERTTKKRGRRKTIMTGSLGVTKVSSDYSLGKPTLLGKV